MYILIDSESLKAISGEFIESIGAKITRIVTKDPLDHKMKGVKLKSLLLAKCDTTPKLKKRDQCVIDFISSQIKGNYTRQKLENELGLIAGFEYGISTLP